MKRRLILLSWMMFCTSFGHAGRCYYPSTPIPKRFVKRVDTVRSLPECENDTVAVLTLTNDAKLYVNMLNTWVDGYITTLQYVVPPTLSDIFTFIKRRIDRGSTGTAASTLPSLTSVRTYFGDRDSSFLWHYTIRMKDGAKTLDCDVYVTSRVHFELNSYGAVQTVLFEGGVIISRHPADSIACLLINWNWT
uniref:GP131 n=1 Tax=Caviid herpesvirus 2 str. CIDMTR TaxID=1415526 RepID=U6H6H1_9BETA|nr:GP131 [Caviid herpesvirus 2 str. CIDMTR]